MKIKVDTPNIKGEVETGEEDGHQYLLVSLLTPGYYKIWWNEAAVELAFQASNYLGEIGHADPFKHDIPELVYKYLGELK